MNTEGYDIINKVFSQNCEDTLKVIEKTDKEVGGYPLYKCEFQKYNCTIFAPKPSIVRGGVMNPQIEIEEFINKKWKQNCGDELEIIEKVLCTEDKRTSFKCKFVNSSIEILSTKSEILKGSVTNPEIEKREFIEKIWPQNCGDTLKILRKTDKSQNGRYLWEAEFINYPCKVIAIKGNIIKGKILNPNFPHRTKENLLSFIRENFKDRKVSLLELSQKLNISFSYTSEIVINYNLSSYIEYQSSNLEKDIRLFLINLNKNIICKEVFIKDINNKELGIDIFSEEDKLGFEINGNYWHSELYKGQLYHQQKTLRANELGIKLFHIFEYEFINQKEKIEYFIKSKLGIFEQKIFARKCTIKEISILQYRNFCNQNHLQNKADAKIKLGLFYKDDLIQIMSFSSPRFTGDYQYEIIRECSKLGYQILGGKERLWKYFVKTYNPNSVLSYCDFSKFSGQSYLKLGFKQERLNKPGFVWWDEKSKNVFWRNPANNQEMKQRYLKIWDAGQLVFTWNKENIN